MRTNERSFGILLHRHLPYDNELEFFLIKPNAPGFWAKAGDIWGFPKGRSEEGESGRETAFREFYEEVGVKAPAMVNYHMLSPFRTSRGKTITIYSGDATGINLEWVGSNNQKFEYPAGSGNFITCPETIAGGWFKESVALQLLDGGFHELISQVIRRERMKLITTGMKAD